MSSAFSNKVIFHWWHKYSLIRNITFLTHWLGASEKEKTLVGWPGSRSSINNNLFADEAAPEFRSLNTFISSKSSTKWVIQCACFSLGWAEAPLINSHILNFLYIWGDNVHTELCPYSLTCTQWWLLLTFSVQAQFWSNTLILKTNKPVNIVNSL